MLLRDLEDDIRFAARKEGRKEGRNEIIYKLFVYLVNKGTDTEKAMKEISEIFQISVQEIEAIVQAEKNADNAEKDACY